MSLIVLQLDTMDIRRKLRVAAGDNEKLSGKSLVQHRTSFRLKSTFENGVLVDSYYVDSVNTTDTNAVTGDSENLSNASANIDDDLVDTAKEILLDMVKAQEVYLVRDTEFECPFDQCGIVFEDERLLGLHLSTHGLASLCMYCHEPRDNKTHKEFVTHIDLCQRATAEARRTYVYNCPIPRCRVSVFSRVVLQEHLVARHKLVACFWKDCSCLLPPQQMEEHVAKTHLQEEASKKTKLNQKKWPHCEYCSWQGYGNRYRKHLFEKHAEKLNIECKYCGELFHKLDSMKKHAAISCPVRRNFQEKEADEAKKYYVEYWRSRTPTQRQAARVKYNAHVIEFFVDNMRKYSTEFLYDNIPAVMASTPKNQKCHEESSLESEPLSSDQTDGAESWSEFWSGNKRALELDSSSEDDYSPSQRAKKKRSL